jgi:hypothetical protein
MTAKTEAGGTFTLRDLPAGTYQLNVNHQRYLPMPGQVPPPVEVKAGETTRVTISLMPGGSITGRVVDEDGDPLSGCWPQLLAARQGDPVGAAGAENSDASGVYSLWGIAPGKFKLVIRCNTQIVEPHPLRAITDPPPPPTLAYPAAYYPGVADAQEAQVLDLAGGQERTGVDFQMKPGRVYTVSGIVRPGNFDMSKLNVMAVQRGQLNRETSATFGASLDTAKGTFTLQGIFPGSYAVIAVMRDESGPQLGVRQEIEVPGTGALELELRPGVEVSGKVEVEGEYKLPLSTIPVQLVETEPVGMGPTASRVMDDGSFTIQGMLPGLYQVNSGGPGLFVKSVTWAGTEISGGIVDASGGGSGPLVVVLSTKTATIKGSGPPNRPLEAIVVFAGNRSSYAGQTDRQGNFTFTGLVPGTYRVRIRGVGDDSSGEEVTVNEGETATITLGDPGGR